MQKTDILIIGGGIAGVGLARALCNLLNHGSSVVVLERESLNGYHSTGRSAATWIQSYGNATVRELNDRSERYFRSPTDIGGGSLLSKRGLLFCVTESDSQNSEADDLLASSNAVSEISTSDAIQLVPILNADRYSRYIYESIASDIDVARLLQAWITQVKGQGGNIYCDNEVTSIERHANHWVVATNSGRWQTSVIVNAAGAWADQIAALASVKPLSLAPLRRTAALVELTNSIDVTHWPLFAEINESWYAKPESGKLLVSPADENLVEPCDALVDDLVLAEGIDRFERGVTSTVTQVTHQWAGLRTFAPDNTPVAGFDSNVDDFFWLVGQGGYGIQTAPALSAIAASILLGQIENTPLVNNLSAQRFDT